MAVSSYIPPLLIAEGHLEVCFLAKRNGGLDYSKPPKKSAVQESVQNPLSVSGFFFSAARQHTPPCQSHTVIPLPAFVQSGIVFSVCGLSKQTRSVPFRTTPEWTYPFPKPGICKALPFRQKWQCSFFCKQIWKPVAQQSSSPMLQRVHSIGSRRCSFYIAVFVSGRWNAKHCFPVFWTFD